MLVGCRVGAGGESTQGGVCQNGDTLSYWAREKTGPKCWSSFKGPFLLRPCESVVKSRVALFSVCEGMLVSW